MSHLCPCNSALEYSVCCQPYLNHERLPETPQTLMRSRYSAYVLQDANYLISTWHPDCHAERLRADLEQGFMHTQWLGLTIFEVLAGTDTDEGFVSFVARFKEQEHPGAIIERSRFHRLNQRWYYLDGTRPTFGRNDPCPCGSGKKYKKCCGLNP